MNQGRRTRNSAPGILIILAVIAVALVFNIDRLKAQTAEKKAASYVGSDMCLQCHDGLDKHVMDTGHRILLVDKKKSGPKAGCEACHGPASGHIDDSSTGINRFEKMKSSQIAAVCLGCHNKGDKTSWMASSHATEHIACTECHSIHGTSSTVKDVAAIKDVAEVNKPKSLLKMDQPDLCFSCHKDKEAEINMPSHHPIKEGKVTCSDCHSPHNNSDLAMNKAKTNCVKCHAEKAGPFVSEHQPVSEDCTTCHNPHGSINQNLLTVQQPTLCLQCHMYTAHTFPQLGAHDTTMTKKCTTCHTSIHGSSAAGNNELF